MEEFDAFPKTLDDFKVKSTLGAFLTIASALVMILLITWEFETFMKVQVDSSLLINRSEHESLWIRLAVHFPSLHCRILRYVELIFFLCFIVFWSICS